MSKDLFSIPVERIDGTPTTLAEHAGKVILIVNVASQCGLTPQYDALEKLYREHRDEGLVVVGFPANNFGSQEPGTNEEIATFCRSTYGVDFPMYSKISVKGEDQHPLYRRLTEERPEIEFKPGSGMLKRRQDRGTPATDRDVAWNFEKFLIDRDGAVVHRFAPNTKPDDPIVIEAITESLRR